ncbi:hypothetical protein C0J52_17589 [Blattella germanica]|nr:hypothetical protein C0J52_17589 [Blattella germanica]
MLGKYHIYIYTATANETKGIEELIKKRAIHKGRNLVQDCKAYNTFQEKLELVDPKQRKYREELEVLYGEAHVKCVILRSSK